MVKELWIVVDGDFRDPLPQRQFRSLHDAAIAVADLHRGFILYGSGPSSCAPTFWFEGKEKFSAKDNADRVVKVVRERLAKWWDAYEKTGKAPETDGPITGPRVAPGTVKPVIDDRRPRDDANHDTNIASWARHQANLLRRIAAGEKISDEIDWGNIAAEIEALATGRTS
jgi:hypothetical protein